MAGLRAYTQRTGEAPIMVSGWDNDDPACGPPAALLERIGAITPQPRHYTYSRDLRLARERAADLLGHDLRLNGARLSAEQVTLGANGTQALLLVLTALRERGIRRLVIAAPCYYAAMAIAQHLRLETVIIPAADFLTGALDGARIGDAARQPGTALLLTNPAYSLGVEYTPEELTSFLAQIPGGTPVVLDETRLGLHWRRRAPWYRADLPGEVLVIRSPSKIFLLHGAKLSLLLGPASWIRQIEQAQEALTGSIPGHTEALALAYLEALAAWRAGEADLLSWRADLVRRLRRTLEAVTAQLAPLDWRLSPVDSGPYTTAAIPRTRDVLLTSERIAQTTGVLLMTTPYYFHDDPSWQGFRIHLCLAPGAIDEALRRAIIRATV